MSETYDAIVLGLGGMGSSAAYHLARRGKRVLGLEQFTPANDRGSSHGRSRIIRQAYAEGAMYVPLLLRAYELWRELEMETGRVLMQITGGLMIGDPSSKTVSGALASARQYGLAHELLDSTDVRRRFPAFHVDREVALYEAVAGALFPEDCVTAHIEQAAASGAELHFETPATAWRAIDDGVEVEAGGQTYRAERLIVTAGAWAGQILAGLSLPLLPERNLIYWFVPAANPEQFAPGLFPIFIWDGPGFPLYGLPDLRGDGPKAGIHHSGVTVDPSDLCRDVHEHEVAAIRQRLQECLPAMNGSLRSAAVCMYTNTPDEHFAIGVHPTLPQVSIAAGFSGHGFKFASIAGEVMADLATDGQTRHPITPFALGRFTDD